MNASPVGKAGIFERGGVRMSDDQYVEIAEWARTCATFTVGGMAKELESMGIPRESFARHGTVLVSLPMAQSITGYWARAGQIRLAGTRLYRWAK